MKTNRFNESIRRKLDGLEPTYREADWKRMQQSLHQHGVPSFWPSASQWLLPTVGALTIAGLLITTIWQYRTTQQLRQTVQTLIHTVKDLKENPPVAQTAPPARVDTVYILQNHMAGQGDRYAGRLDGAGSVVGGSGLVPDPQLSERAVATDGSGISEERPSPEATGEQRVAATPGDRSRAEETSASAPSAARDNRIVTSSGSLKITPYAERTAIQLFSDASANDRRLTSRSATRRSGRTQTGRAGNAFERPGDESSATPVPSVEESGVLRLNVQQLAPVAPSFNTDRFVEGLNRRARRIRSALPLSVGSMASSAAPKAPAIERDEPNVRVRLGLSGALAFKQMAGGVYGEAIVGRHLTVGIGLNRVVESGGKYVTDFQFNQRNHRDFRKEYAHGLDPRFEIFNIARQNYCWKLPVSLGYRMMLGNGLALIPSAGLNINVNTASQEKVEFTYRRGPQELKPIAFWVPRPTSRLSDGTVAFLAEKQWLNHWVVQAGPYAAIPLQPSPNGFNPLTAGLRARVLFQF